MPDPTPTPMAPQEPPLDPEIAKYDQALLKELYEQAALAVNTSGTSKLPGFVARPSFEVASRQPGRVAGIIQEGRYFKPELPTLSQVKVASQISTQITEGETRAKEADRRAQALFAADLADVGGSYDPVAGKITYDPTHPFQVSKRLKAEHEQAALEGKLPIPSALENDLQRQEQQLRETLLNQLGPGWETSTPGSRALQEFQKRANETRDAARRGDIQQFAGLSAAASQQQTGTQPNLAYATLYAQPAAQAQGFLGYQVGQQQFGYQAEAARQALALERERIASQERGALYGVVGQATGLTGALAFGGRPRR